jgi:hypothetical protein
MVVNCLEETLQAVNGDLPVFPLYIYNIYLIYMTLGRNVHEDW